MTLWDYLDKHWIVGPSLMLILGFCALVACENVLVTFANALRRGRK